MAIQAREDDFKTKVYAVYLNAYAVVASEGQLQEQVAATHIDIELAVARAVGASDAADETELRTRTELIEQVATLLDVEEKEEPSE
jgi:hypothetical protein